MRPIPAVTRVEELPVQIHSPTFAAEAAQLDRHYALKTGITLALGALIVGVAALASLLYRRERRLLESQAAFARTVSHELRTPIASLRLMGETLERRLAGSEAAKDFPSRIVAEADRLNFLVENVLSFNRLDRARVAVSRRPATVEDLVDAVRPDLPAFTSKPVRLTVAAGGDLALSVDHELLRLLLSNLVNNSCKYNDRESVEIAVEATASGARAVVTVTDNGRGIPEEDWERVFTEFERSKSPAGARGFGLGLALCRRIMALHGGTLRITRSDGSGTTFEMTFPRAEAEIEARA
jgi:signal transduction histidine kinase